MQIQVLNVSELTEKLKMQLEEWPALHDNSVRVERAAAINKTPDRTPWVGIYRQNQSFEARTLGMGTTGFRRHNITLALVLQEASSKSGEDCERRLEKLVSEVVSAICSDESIRGSALAISPDPMSLTYASYQVDDNNFFQEAVLLFTVVTNVSVTG
jgi:hypothetical protein